MAIHVSNMKELNKALQPIMLKMVDLLADRVYETLLDCMAEDEKVMINGFGRFEMKTYKERICRSPIGGENCTIPEHKKMRFYVSELLGNRIEER